MNSNHCSRILLAVLVLAVIGTSITGAVTVTQDNIPSEAEVGSDQGGTIILENLYQDPAYEQWTLQGETELENVTWTIQLVDQAGNVIEQQSHDGTTVQQSVNITTGTAQIAVNLTGDVPPVSDYTYEPAPQFVFAELTQVRQNGTQNTIEQWHTEHYTVESQQARIAIEAAEKAIESAGGHQEAEQTLNDSKEFYEAARFDRAIEVAERAETTAKESQSQSLLVKLVLWVVGAVIVILILIGAVYWYRSQDQSSRL